MRSSPVSSFQGAKCRLLPPQWAVTDLCGKGSPVRPAVIASALVLATVTLLPMTAQAQRDPLPTPTPTQTQFNPDGVGGIPIETISYGSHVRQSMDVWWTP